MSSAVALTLKIDPILKVPKMDPPQIKNTTAIIKAVIKIPKIRLRRCMVVHLNPSQYVPLFRFQTLTP